MDIAQKMLTKFNDDPDLLKRAITGHESWVFGDVIETLAQSLQRNSPEEPRPQQARKVWTNVKVLLTVFFDCNGVMHPIAYIICLNT